MVNLLIDLFLNICLSLQNVNIAWAVSRSWFVKCEHFHNELTIHVAVHVKYSLHRWEIFQCAPILRFFILINHATLFLSFSFVFLNIAFLDGAHFELSEHALVLSPVENCE